LNFESLGNIGEFIAAIGVVISLCYVAYEVRKNSVIQLRGNHRALMTGLHDAIRPAVENAEFANLYASAIEDMSNLTSGERYQVDMYTMSWLHSIEIALVDYEKGLMDEETLEPYKAAVAGHLRRPGGTQWWNERRAWFSRTGQDAIDSIIRDDTIEGKGAGAAPNV